MPVAGSVALVTGANRRLGRVYARELLGSPVFGAVETGQVEILLPAFRFRSLNTMRPGM